MFVQNPLNNTIGHWIPDSEDMPCFAYTGNVPVTTTLKDGTRVKLPEDPWFIIGNYRINVFPHVSGDYELITG